MSKQDSTRPDDPAGTPDHDPAGAYDALRKVLEVLDRGNLLPDLEGTLRPLEHGADYTWAVLRSLRDLADWPGGDR